MIHPGYTLSFLTWLFGEIVSGSVGIAKVAIGGRGDTHPAILELPLRCRTDFEIIAFASSITITPGTLVVGTAHGTATSPPTLFVHVLQAGSREEAIADLRVMEDRLLRATRGRGGADVAPRIRQAAAEPRRPRRRPGRGRTTAGSTRRETLADPRTQTPSETRTDTPREGQR
ncbi:Na+/H+ antiporter subunit E [Brachybacterium sp. EF45031]|uniref:Na+/H+ antiporter subunit E n=1 Tax=Brachybacterium sillae TaxID=2810536 RepID=UPI00217ED23D|nr:Na+/H+ antiporter subunit E [Brachybacterium sillae]MCS6711946.1 Na+/H+ antiporter subunit E [Brachybacterium sillae]